MDPLPYEEPEILNDVELVEAQIIAAPGRDGSTDENESASESGSESQSMIRIRIKMTKGRSPYVLEPRSLRIINQFFNGQTSMGN